MLRRQCFSFELFCWCCIAILFAAARTQAMDAPVPYPGWRIDGSYPHDVAIDHQTHDIYVPLWSGKKLTVLLGGVAPRVALYSGPWSLIGSSLIHRTCTSSGVTLYGLLFTEFDGGTGKYLPLPLPADPATNAARTIETVAPGLSQPCWLTQTHLSIELYVAEYGGAKISHWAVRSPPLVTDGTADAIPSLSKIRDIGRVGSAQGVAITSDDNVLLVSEHGHAIHKVAPMLPHSTTPDLTSLNSAVNTPQKITLHPAHNSADDFVLYIANRGMGNVLQYNSTTATTSELLSSFAFGVTIHPKGDLLIFAPDAVELSCCVDSFDPFTQLAGYMNTTCLVNSCSADNECSSGSCKTFCCTKNDANCLECDATGVCTTTQYSIVIRDETITNGATFPDPNNLQHADVHNVLLERVSVASRILLRFNFTFCKANGYRRGLGEKGCNITIVDSRFGGDSEVWIEDEKVTDDTTGDPLPEKFYTTTKDDAFFPFVRIEGNDFINSLLVFAHFNVLLQLDDGQETTSAGANNAAGLFVSRNTIERTTDVQKELLGGTHVGSDIFRMDTIYGFAVAFVGSFTLVSPSRRDKRENVAATFFDNSIFCGSSSQHPFGVLVDSCPFRLDNGVPFRISNTRIAATSNSHNAYGLYHHISSSITLNNMSVYSIVRSTIAATTTRSDYTALGLYYRVSPITLNNMSVYSVVNSTITASSDHNAFGLHHTSSSFTLNSMSVYMITNSTITASSGHHHAYGLHHRSSSIKLNNMSSYNIVNSTITATSIDYHAYALYHYISSPIKLNNMSSYNIVSSTIAATSNSNNAYGLHHYSSSVALYDVSVYSIVNSTIAATSSSQVAFSLYLYSSSVILNDTSMYNIVNSTLAATSDSNNARGLHYQFSSVALNSGSSYALYIVVIASTAPINRYYISGSGTEPLFTCDDGWLMLGNVTGLEITHGGDSKSTFSSRCNVSVFGSTLPRGQKHWIDDGATFDAQTNTRFQCNKNEEGYELTLDDYGRESVLPCGVCEIGLQCHPANTLEASVNPGYDAATTTLPCMCTCDDNVAASVAVSAAFLLRSKPSTSTAAAADSEQNADADSEQHADADSF